MNNLHPGARWLFRIRAFWSLLFFFIFILFFGMSSVLRANTWQYLLIALVVLIFIIEIYARMSYNRWLYEIGKDSIRLERGIIWKRYSNIPYERVQNIDIHRGIIARMCGFSSVMIQTAGYSMPMGAGYGGHAEGLIPAVEVQYAEQIREFVLKKIKGKNQGL